MEAAPNASSTTTSSDRFHISDNTLTFIIGFSILILFVILGMLASAFLCLTLKKDPYLWAAGRDNQLTQERADDAGANSKLGDKVAMMDELSNQESTQI